MMKSNDTPLLEAKDLGQYYLVKTGLFKSPAILRAVSKVSFTLTQGKTLAVVGESGSGKSTLARMITMIEPPATGMLRIEEHNIIGANSYTLKKLRPVVQMVFQNPYASLNPRKKIGTILEEPLKINTGLNAQEREETARNLMAKVGLRPEHYNRYPHMFSGGQRQRVAIARALMLKPKIVVADEPVSALDVSIRAQVLNLMLELQKEFNLAYLFISHDLSVVKHIADDVLVMYLGRPVEYGSKRSIYHTPLHPYTRALLSSTPSVDPALRMKKEIIKGELPSPFNPPSGCAFHKRCPHATEECVQKFPELRKVKEQLVACHYAERWV
ncbi:MAG: dipeptide ABC transporter ATP-binding protein [Alphaproteobacteria bacterium]|nr:dipeptide ABC transporter ATP-binding protein [Alphaproteobacteria bacterium]